VIKRTQLVGSVSPGRVSRARRNRWPDRDAALRALPAQEGLCCAGTRQVLADYIDHGTHDEDGRTHAAAFNRDVETAIYNTLPDNLDRLAASDTRSNARWPSSAAPARPR
jgi:hypothetical protein